MRTLIRLLAAVLLLPALAGAQPQGGTRLLRYPDIQGDTIAFVYAGDIWVVDADGGLARRLTSHEGEELFPKLSPDGRWIAFTGQYSGTRQVHVIGVDGGAPRQLTFYNDIGELPPRGGVDNQVLDWTPDGKQVLFIAHRVPWSERIGRPYLVPAAGGMETPLPMPEGAGGMLSPDGGTLVYTPIMREFRTWKRYRGGRAQDVWVYDLKANTSERLTDFPGTDNQPMWIGDTIYFTSDRDGKLNLYALERATKAVRKVTDHDRYDVLWPSAGSERIVYENGGWLYRFDPQTGRSDRVEVQVYGDFAGTVPYFKNVRSEVQALGVSPTGKRAVIGARGELFTVPAKEGEIRNLTATARVREMDPTWSPDGRWIAYLSDRSGEYEIYVRPADGTGEERRVTTDGGIWRFAPVWSPDGTKLAFGDKEQRLRYVEVASGKVVDVDRSTYEDLTVYRWSPDSRWIAYPKTGETQMSSIWVYSLDQGKAHRLTGEQTAEFDPVFDPSGRYLYFLSNRDFNLTFSDYEFDYFYTDPTRVYVGILAKDGPALFLPESDEEAAKAEEGAAAAGDAKAGAAEKGAAAETKGDEDADSAAKKKAPKVKIDVDGFEQRVRAIPGSPGDYQSLAATADGVLYLSGQGPNAALKLYDLKEKKEEVVLQGISGYELSADGTKVLYLKGEDVGIADAKPGQDASKGRLALDELTVKVEPREEWRQMYADAWRILRDWFYDPGLHGVDWKEVRERYGELVPYVASRQDLDYVLGEIAGELNAGHAYVEPAEQSPVERIDGGLLGAEIEAHPSGYFRIARIFPGENWHQDFRSPLTEPGVRVKAGDFILAVDGTSTKGVDNFYRLLENKADRVVTLTVNGEPRPAGARQERVRPIKNEENLRYLAWVEGTREHVDKASGGRIGYIHLPNTAVEGNRELFKHFYPQSHKEALIIDVRYNGGGFIPDRMIALLTRPLLSYWQARGLAPSPTPGFSHQGPKVALINGQAGSGGDAFPYYFKKLGMGPLIGTRTWGGLIGISGNPSLIDGGTVTTPAFRFFDTEGAWAVEGVGVAPDIEVIDRPDLVAKGIDPSLEKGIEVLMQQLEKNPPAKPKVPAPWREGMPLGQ